VSCPACGEALAGGQDRCPACGSALGAPTEGALAPDLMRREPRERLAEVPTFRKREPSWKDEVRERVRHRKKYRSDGEELPLFPDKAASIEEAAPAPPSDAPEPIEPLLASGVDDSMSLEPRAKEARDEGPLSEDVDLPLRPQEPDFDDVEASPAEPSAAPAGPRLVELDEQPVEAATSWSADDFETSDPTEPVKDIERPAYLGERVRAAALDALTIALVAAIVVYFASRAARVAPLGLLPAWPYVAGFLALFALVYAAFFTGLTGQTLGKMAFRLRVVDRAGAPPGHVRAALRAALGALGSLALVGILPVFLDPARRALHDRLLKTRVIHL
jgi:uncharacterized RDD family membrane protein YckC